MCGEGKVLLGDIEIGSVRCLFSNSVGEVEYLTTPRDLEGTIRPRREGRRGVTGVSDRSPARRPTEPPGAARTHLSL